MAKKTLLVILGSGGHTAQMIDLVNRLGDAFKYHYIVQKEDVLSQKKIRKAGTVSFVNSPRRYGESIVISIARTIRTLYQSMKIMVQSDAVAVVSAGPGVAVPISFIGKLFRKKIIFLESWSRVYNKSRSGRIAYGFADQFFVQWPELKQEYPKAIYAGRLK